MESIKLYRIDTVIQQSHDPASGSKRFLREHSNAVEFGFFLTVILAVWQYRQRSYDGCRHQRNV
jgi:hypothetical protein